MGDRRGGCSDLRSLCVLCTQRLGNQASVGLRAGLFQSAGSSSSVLSGALVTSSWCHALQSPFLLFLSVMMSLFSPPDPFAHGSSSRSFRVWASLPWRMCGCPRLCTLPSLLHNRLGWPRGLVSAGRLQASGLFSYIHCLAAVSWKSWRLVEEVHPRVLVQEGPVHVHVRSGVSLKFPFPGEQSPSGV